jgi:hypothetical protein
MDEKKRKEKKNPGGVFMPVFSYYFESFPKTCPPPSMLKSLLG